MAASETVKRVEESLRAAGIQPEIMEFPQSTRTAEEAAAAVGADVGQIGKSLVFLSVAGDRETPFLAIVSGRNRADTNKLEGVVGGKVKRASADLVREVTGFAIGGVPPLGHTSYLPVLIDQDLAQYPGLFLAAGTPHAVFPCSFDDLIRITGGRVVNLREG